MPPNGQPSRGILFQIAEMANALTELEKQVRSQSDALLRMEGLPEQVQSLRKAAWWVAGVLIIASITFAFAVLGRVA